MSRLSQGLATITVLIGTALLVYYSREISQFIVNLVGPQEVTKIEAPKQKVGTLTSQGQSSREVHHLDEFKVPAGQHMTFTTQSGWVLEFTENAEVIFELYRPESSDSPLLVTFRSGDFRLMTAGAIGMLFVMKDKKIFSPQVAPQKEAIRTVELQQTPVAKSDEVTELTEDIRVQEKPLKLSRSGRSTMPEKVTTYDNKETLSNAYIEQVLLGQANSLRNCQLSSIRDKKMAQGLLIVSFSILPSGKIEKLAVAKDQIQNAQLVNCVISVLERTHFKAFAGAPIQLSYPIEFR
jgi:hypothetical protein